MFVISSLTEIDITHLVHAYGDRGEIRYAKKCGNRVTISFNTCEQSNGAYGLVIGIDDSIYPENIQFGSGVSNGNNTHTAVSPYTESFNGVKGLFCNSGKTELISGSITYYL